MVRKGGQGCGKERHANQAEQSQLSEEGSAGTPGADHCGLAQSNSVGGGMSDKVD